MGHGGTKSVRPNFSYGVQLVIVVFVWSVDSYSTLRALVVKKSGGLFEAARLACFANCVAI
jgi:hypothetical protein